MKLIFQYSPWLVILCFLVGALYAFLLYRKDRRLIEFPLYLIRSLAIVRFLSASLLAFLLLSPLVKYISRQVAEPILIIAEDHSESLILSADSNRVKNDLPSFLDEVDSELKDEFQIENYLFGESVKKKDNASTHSDRYSNFEELFKEVKNRYENRNVGAMVLISDGVFNRGMNPIYSAEQSQFPIYTIALGDTNQRKDLLISNVFSNRIAFLGNQFPIKVDYKALKAKGVKTKLKLFNKGKLLDEKELTFDNDKSFGTVDFLVKAEQIGLQTYQLSIQSIKNESSFSNNTQNVYVDVLDSRQKILLTYQSPHPDIAAIQRAISSTENYKVESIQIDKRAVQIKTYDLIIAHGLLSGRSAKGKDLISEAREKEIPILFFADQSTDWNYLNGLNTAVEAANPTRSLNEVYPLYETAFPLFKLTDEQAEALKSYPPIKVPQANFSISEQSYVLLRQQIGNVPTKFPLLVFNQNDKRKEGVFIGEGLWRWRINNYSRFGNHKQFDQFISKIIQYLSVKADKSYFRLSHEKEIMENEKLRFDLQIFNKAYDPIIDPAAFMVVEDENGNQFNYQFNRSTNAYFIELSGLNIGNYTYRAYADYDQKRLEQSGRFSIREIKIESVQLVADYNLLYQIASKSGGRNYYELNAKDLAEELLSREDISSLSYTTEDVEDIINLKWIFFILVFLLVLEWFIRKYQGAY